MSLEADVGKPLLDVLREVVLDPAKQAAFSGDPSGYLAEYGYEDVPADDVSEALSLVADTLPPEAAQAVAAAAPLAPASPADELGDMGGHLGADPGSDPEGDAFGEVTQDFDAFAAGADGSDLDDDLDGDFGTGEVAAVGDGYDDGAFGEGSEVGSGYAVADDGVLHDGSLDDGLDDGVDLPDDPPDGYDDSPLDPDHVVLDDGLDDGVDHPGGYDDSAVDADDGDLPDDPGDFLDDIGSF